MITARRSHGRKRNGNRTRSSNEAATAQRSPGLGKLPLAEAPVQKIRMGWQCETPPPHVEAVSGSSLDHQWIHGNDSD
jgi:hypothetical protein